MPVTTDYAAAEDARLREGEERGRSEQAWSALEHCSRALNHAEARQYDLTDRAEAAERERDALAQRVARLEAALRDCCEIIELADPWGEPPASHAPEDAAVGALCRQVGYGAVMGSAARQWRRLDPGGALLVGSCPTLSQDALRRAYQLIKRQGTSAEQPPAPAQEG